MSKTLQARVFEFLKPVGAAIGLFLVAGLWLFALHGGGLMKAFDLTGIAACAYVGACAGWKISSKVTNKFARLALVTVAALLTGCGGGALVRNPLLYADFIPYPLREPEYIAVVIASVFLSAIDLQARIARHDDIAAFADAIANALFTFAGANAALVAFGDKPTAAVIAMFAAFASATGGGIIRDLVLDGVAGRFRGLFKTVLSPYRAASLVGAFLVVSLLLTYPSYAWFGALVGGLLAYLGRNVKFVDPQDQE